MKRIRLGSDFPWITATVLLGAVIVSGVPALSIGAVGVREKIVAGQIWRLWTAHFVHFSPSHLVWNALVLALAGAAVERRDRRVAVALWVVAAPVVTWFALASDPGLASYGGLSGLAVSAVVWLALEGCLTARGLQRWLALGILAMLAIKIGWEWSAAGAMFLLARFDSPGVMVRVAVGAHLAGAGCAIFLVGWRRLNDAFRNADNRRQGIAAGQ